MKRRDLIARLGALGMFSPAMVRGDAALQKPRHGRLERLTLPAWRHVAERPVEVWLPPGYDGRRPHAVLYMHDGQMLYDAATTWNQQAWALDQVAAPLLAEGKLQDFIVVGIWNAGEARRAEYFPQAWLPLIEPASERQRYIDEALQGQPRGDAYLRFLVEELKPAVDARYATRPEREATLLMGSSMGGLISVYALCEYPQVFGAAAALSTHWIGLFERNEAIPAAALAYLERRLPPPERLRLYMDRGTTELDALYDRAQAGVDALLARKGYGPPRVVSRVFEGAGHNEAAWRARLDQPLQFLLGAKR
ncbi:alpha/beta hydrolase [Roseateles violae]|uniref:Alpha/beta hydrolase-fold protein n=1 Tax=Roseateles violae TaxID=3058042 RepID=A0ABT8DV02_9BURK|nr:alpha/beta hydrolase-fold protein [Pelomonas sp. PFR6]MDN3921953.1 alpha/beta hydrolase-fold protein [Pelomonas sp. PFR6]